MKQYAEYQINVIHNIIIFFFFQSNIYNRTINQLNAKFFSNFNII